MTQEEYREIVAASGEEAKNEGCGATLTELFDLRAKEAPDAIAVVHEDEHISLLHSLPQGQHPGQFT